MGNQRATSGPPAWHRPPAGRDSLPVATPRLAAGVLRTHKAVACGNKRQSDKHAWRMCNIVIIVIVVVIAILIAIVLMGPHMGNQRATDPRTMFYIY